MYGTVQDILVACNEEAQLYVVVQRSTIVLYREPFVFENVEEEPTNYHTKSKAVFEQKLTKKLR